MEDVSNSNWNMGTFIYLGLDCTLCESSIKSSAVTNVHQIVFNYRDFLSYPCSTLNSFVMSHSIAVV